MKIQKSYFHCLKKGKLSVLISPRNLYIYIEKHKRKEKNIFIHLNVYYRNAFKRYVRVCMFIHNLLFSICSVDHELNQILERTWHTHLHILQFLLLMHVFVYSQTELASKIQSITLDASLHGRVDNSMRNIWISTAIQHVNWEGDFFIIFFCFWQAGVGMKWVLVPFEGHMWMWWN